MRVNIQRLSEPGNKPLAAVYLLFGDELLLIEEASSALRKKARAEGYSERTSFVAEPGFDWNELLQTGSSMSLFSDKQLIELRIPTGKPGQTGSRVLCELAENLPEDTLLLIICGSVDRAGQNQKWFKSLDRAGVNAEAKQLRLDEFPGWIANRLRSKGLLADKESIGLLTYYFEGNLLAAAQEIDLLALNVRQGINMDAQQQLAALQSSVSDNSRFSVYSYIDSCLAGDWQRTSRVLDGLKAENESAVLLMVMLGREARNLVQMSAALARGVKLEQVFNQFHVWRNRQPVVAKALRRHSQEGWQQILQQIANIDRIIKGRAPSEGTSMWFDIEKLSMQVCGLEVIKTI